MKKKVIIISLSVLMIAFSLFAACAADRQNSGTPPTNAGVVTPSTDYDAQIRALETQIAMLQQNQYISDAEYQKELQALIKQLESLKQEASKDETNPSGQGNQQSSARFLYKVSDGQAIITGYTGSASHLVIPSSIDGYAVYGIDEGAFSSSTIKSITLSSGICKIDWFAFRDCTRLESITIPASVTSIGYLAFPENSSVLTIYCHSGTFAHSYAKSYGLNYAVI